MRTVDTAAFCARLGAWHETLRQLGTPKHKGEDAPVVINGRRVVWIESTQLVHVTTALLPVQRVCEALNLLTLLALVDVAAWRREMAAVWTKKGVLEWLEYSLTPLATQQFEVGLELNELSLADTKNLKRLQEKTQEPSGDYKEAYAVLLAAVQSVGGDVEAMVREVFVRVRVELNCSDCLPNQATGMLKRTAALAKALNTASVRALGPQFVFDELLFKSSVGVILDEHGVAVLHQLHSTAVHIGHLPPVGIVDAEKARCDVAKTLQSVVDVDRNALPRRPSRFAVTDRFSRSVMISVISAVQESKSTPSTVEIEFGEYEDFDMNDWDEQDERLDQTENWQWAAYALFSRHANHSIRTLEITLDGLRDEFVDAMRQVIEADDPIHELVEHEDSEVDIEYLRASRFHLVDPAERRPKQRVPRGAVLTTPSPIAVRVFHPPVSRYGDFWTVLLPGHGQAWVHEDDVASLCIPEPAPPRPGFERIVVTRLSNEAIDASMALLQLICHSTRRIEVQEHIEDDPEFIDDWCQRVLEMSPRLEELVLRRAFIGDLEAFVAAASTGHFRLQKLHLFHVFAREPRALAGFFHALSEPAHAIAVHLRDLEVFFEIEGDALDDAILAPILRMLETNRSLLTIHVGFHLYQHASHARLEAAILGAFARHVDERVAVPVAPLDAASKRAFVSAVYGDGADCRAQLDASVVASIFQFAAPARTRSFHVSCTKVVQMTDGFF